jgi:hypothetical protein
MYPQAAFFDGDAGPDPSDQLLLGNDLPGLLQQRDKDIESPSPDLNRHSVPLQKSLGEVQLEWAKFHDVWRDTGTSIHKIF